MEGFAYNQLGERYKEVLRAYSSWNRVPLRGVRWEPVSRDGLDDGILATFRDGTVVRIDSVDYHARRLA